MQNTTGNSFFSESLTDKFCIIKKKVGPVAQLDRASAF